jgi:glutathione synthase/RimK-type ligase-like ATP-grasp enzyme
LTRTKIGLSVQGTSIYLEDRSIVLSESIVKRWKIPTNQTLTLRFGSVKHEVKVVQAAIKNTLRMNPAIAAMLGLHHGVKLCIHYKAESNTLSLGPLVGVMVSRLYPGSTDRPFGTVTAFCKEMTEACQNFGALVIFFTPDEMHASSSSSSRITGHAYVNGSWINKSFPIPNIIYNRLTSRKYENQVNVQNFMKDVKSRYQTVIFNEKYLDKTEVFDALKKDASLHSYLPESHLLKNFQLLKSMANRHPVLFLKPITGSLGKGIIRVRKEEDGSYTCHFTNLNGVRKQSFSSIASVFSALSGKLKSQRYQIQQGLNLVTVDGRPIDFRALVHKNALGMWEITSIVARIAGNEHFVSNLARGGSLSTVKEAVAKSSLSSEWRALVQAKLRKAALNIATGIETQIQSHFGELGIDLAVDNQGKVWLLEVNSKPSKDENTSLNADMKIRPSVKQVVQYARYLAKF